MGEYVWEEEKNEIDSEIISKDISKNMFKKIFSGSYFSGALLPSLAFRGRDGGTKIDAGDS